MTLKTAPLALELEFTVEDYILFNSKQTNMRELPSHVKGARFRSGYAFLQATVIVGHRERDDLSVTSEDKVFTCQFGRHGHLSSVGKEFEGQELTVIVHIPE